MFVFNQHNLLVERKRRPGTSAQNLAEKGPFRHDCLVLRRLIKKKLVKRATCG
jgi:hypothetical protein